MHRRVEQEKRGSGQGSAQVLRHPLLHGHPQHQGHEHRQRVQLHHPGEFLHWICLLTILFLISRIFPAGDLGCTQPLRDNESGQGEEEEAEGDERRRPEVVSLDLNTTSVLKW